MRASGALYGCNMKDTTFLNVDLEIESDSDLQSLIDEFGDAVSVLGHRKEGDRFFATFETGYGDPNRIIMEYLRLVKNLSPIVRKHWDNCSPKVFDIGIESGIVPRMYKVELSEESTNAISEMGGKVVVSVYSYDADSE